MTTAAKLEADIIKSTNIIHYVLLILSSTISINLIILFHFKHKFCNDIHFYSDIIIG